MDRPPAGKLKKSVRFRAKIPILHDDGRPIPAEWSLHCPACEYDLTGLTDRRCPECGRLFKPYDIWISNRQKDARLHFRTPAYVPYTVLLLAIALVGPLIKDHPVALLPFAVLPFYELAAWRYKWEAWTTRTVVILLCSIAVITTWTLVR